MVAADAVNLPIRDGLFDAALSIAVLHHISSEVCLDETQSQIAFGIGIDIGIGRRLRSNTQTWYKNVLFAEPPPLAMNWNLYSLPCVA